MGLGARLTLLLAGVAAATALIVGTASYVTTDRQVSAEVDDFLLQRAGEISQGQREQPRDRRDRGAEQPVISVSPDAEVQTLNDNGDIDANTDIIDASVPPDAMLDTFEGTITAPVQPEELVAGGNALWLRESGRGRVIRLDPAGEAEPVEVYRAGETYGDVTARDPAAIAWDASTQRLLIIDAGRSLFAVDIGNDTAAPLALRDADEMRSVAGIAVYLGNLYILDPDGGEVWRYLPAAEGFDSERTGILGGVDLAGSTGLAVDGEVFVLDAPSLRHFVQGREEEPMLRGIDTPTETPVGLVEDVLREIVYVADRGGGRIVASDREGEFFRQYRHPDFIDLRGVAVAPDGTALYALTSDGISSFPVTPR